MDKYGQIWTKLTKKKQNGCENDVTILFVISPKQDFEKNNQCQFEGIIGHYVTVKRDL